MKINELIQDFVIQTSNEKKKMLNKRSWNLYLSLHKALGHNFHCLT